jgi:hypothetical protein
MDAKYTVEMQQNLYDMEYADDEAARAAAKSIRDEIDKKVIAEITKTVVEKIIEEDPEIDEDDEFNLRAGIATPKPKAQQVKLPDGRWATISQEQIDYMNRVHGIDMIEAMKHAKITKIDNDDARGIAIQQGIRDE